MARFVERFALLLSDAGMQRMPARVFTCLLTTEAGRLSATELAESLQVSPAAISGAVRYLEQVNMIRRGREPGERRDHYALADESWFELMAHRDKLLAAWAVAMADGADLLGRDTRAGKRLAMTQLFFEFMRREMETLGDRWRAELAAKGLG
ncbi:MarR family protein [Actinokineospora auranticolor]|uniref:MarR family protein n=1 Tax=Actinokineospora auranticolor TaxID=155976 RepID=A0A2S6GL02_9PSEU|nr:MarR family protein [Actinokineospora auranticolor]